MRHPQTGLFSEAGASLPGFVPPLGDTAEPGKMVAGTIVADPIVAGKIAQLLHHAKVREQDNAMRALAALEGSDPILHPIASVVRAKVKGVLSAYDAKLAAFHASREYRDLNHQAIARREQALVAERDAALDKLESDLRGQLDTVTAKLERQLAALRGTTVTAEEVAEAHAMADRLRYLSPDRALGELAEYLDQIGVGERPRGELVALLPVLQSAYEVGPLKGRANLEQLIVIGESLVDGGWQGSVLQARLERAERLAGDLATFTYVAKSGPAWMLDMTVTQSVDHEARREGGFALFPDLPPPSGPAVEDKETHDASLRAAWQKELQDSRDAIAQSQEP